jgi:hypothetical protein
MSSPGTDVEPSPTGTDTLAAAPSVEALELEGGTWFADGAEVLWRRVPEVRNGWVLLSDDELAAVAGRPLPGGVDSVPVLVHAAGEFVRVPVRGPGGATRWVRMTPEQVARMLDGWLAADATVALLSCAAGASVDGFASRMAVALGRDVLTPATGQMAALGGPTPAPGSRAEVDGLPLAELSVRVAPVGLATAGGTGVGFVLREGWWELPVLAVTGAHPVVVSGWGLTGLPPERDFVSLYEGRFVGLLRVGDHIVGAYPPVGVDMAGLGTEALEVDRSGVLVAGGVHESFVGGVYSVLSVDRDVITVAWRPGVRFGGEVLLGRPVDPRAEVLEQVRVAAAEAGYRVEVVAEEPVNVFGIGLGLGVARDDVVRAYHERARAEVPNLTDPHPGTRRAAVQRLADFLADEAGILRVTVRVEPPFVGCFDAGEWMLRVRDERIDVDRLVEVIVHEMTHAWQDWMAVRVLAHAAGRVEVLRRWLPTVDPRVLEAVMAAPLPPGAPGYAAAAAWLDATRGSGMAHTMTLSGGGLGPQLRRVREVYGSAEAQARAGALDRADLAALRADHLALTHEYDDAYGSYALLAHEAHAFVVQGMLARLGSVVPDWSLETVPAPREGYELTRIPAGLHLHPVGATSSLDLAGVRVDRDHMRLLVEPGVDPRVAGELLSALPPGTVIDVLPRAAVSPEQVVRLVGELAHYRPDVVVGVPADLLTARPARTNGIVPVDFRGRASLPELATDYRFGAPGQRIASVPDPVMGAPIRPGVYRVADGWVLEQRDEGVWVHRDDPSAGAGPASPRPGGARRPRMIVGTPGQDTPDLAVAKAWAWLHLNLLPEIEPEVVIFGGTFNPAALPAPLRAKLEFLRRAELAGEALSPENVERERQRLLDQGGFAPANGWFRTYAEEEELTRRALVATYLNTAPSGNLHGYLNDRWLRRWGESPAEAAAGFVTDFLASDAAQLPVFAGTARVVLQLPWEDLEGLGDGSTLSFPIPLVASTGPVVGRPGHVHLVVNSRSAVDMHSWREHGVLIRPNARFTIRELESAEDGSVVAVLDEVPGPAWAGWGERASTPTTPPPTAVDHRVLGSSPVGFLASARGAILFLERSGWRLPDGAMRIAPMPDRVTIAVAAPPDAPYRALADAIVSMVEELYGGYPPPLRLLVNGTGDDNAVADLVASWLPDGDVVAPRGAWSVAPDGRIASPAGWIRHSATAAPTDAAGVAGVADLAGTGAAAAGPAQPTVGPELVITDSGNRLAAWVDSILAAAPDDAGFTRLDMLRRAFYGLESDIVQDADPLNAFADAVSRRWEEVGAFPERVAANLLLHGPGSTVFLAGRLATGERGFGVLRNEGGELFWIDVSGGTVDGWVSPYPPGQPLPLDDASVLLVTGAGVGLPLLDMRDVPAWSDGLSGIDRGGASGGRYKRSRIRAGMVLAEAGVPPIEELVNAAPLADRLTIAVNPPGTLPRVQARAILDVLNELYPQGPPPLRLLADGQDGRNLVAEWLARRLPAGGSILAPGGEWSVEDDGTITVAGSPSPGGFVLYHTNPLPPATVDRTAEERIASYRPNPDLGEAEDLHPIDHEGDEAEDVEGDPHFTQPLPSTVVGLRHDDGRASGLTPFMVRRWFDDSGIDLPESTLFQAALIHTLYPHAEDSDMDVDEPSFPAETTFAVTEADRFLDLVRQRVRSSLEDDQRDVIEAVNAVARRILDTYPPDRYVYVGPGRSPAPIIARLSTLDPRVTAVNMPLSNFQPGPAEPDSILASVLDDPPLTGEQEHMLHRHFTEFLGALPADRDILLVDYVDTGKRLTAVQHHLQRYVQSLGRSAQVHALGLHAGGNENLRLIEHIGSGPGHGSEPSSRQQERADWTARFQVLLLDHEGPLGEELGQALLQGMHLRGFDGLAEYGAYHLLEESPGRFEQDRPRRGVAAQEGYEILREVMSDPAHRRPSDAADAGSGNEMDLTRQDENPSDTDSVPQRPPAGSSTGPGMLAGARAVTARAGVPTQSVVQPAADPVGGRPRSDDADALPRITEERCALLGLSGPGADVYAGLSDLPDGRSADDRRVGQPFSPVDTDPAVA